MLGLVLCWIGLGTYLPLTPKMLDAGVERVRLGGTDFL